MTDVLDVRVLEDLADDLGDLAARRIAKRFSDELERRLDLIADGVAERSAWAVYDTATSLAASSATVGAVPLARAAWAMTHDIVRHRTLPRAATLRTLERLAHDTEAALARHSVTGLRSSVTAGPG